MIYRKFAGIIQALLLFFLAVVVINNIYIMIMQVVFAKDLPKVFGFAQAIVVSGSMQPVIQVGDLLIIKEQREYRVDDIITYRSNNSLITHRVIGIDGSKILTKGDSNNVADEPIQASIVEGRVVLRVPRLGKLILFLKTPFGVLLLVLAAILILEVPFWGGQKNKGGQL